MMRADYLKKRSFGLGSLVSKENRNKVKARTVKLIKVGADYTGKLGEKFGISMKRMDKKKINLGGKRLSF